MSAPAVEARAASSTIALTVVESSATQIVGSGILHSTGDLFLTLTAVDVLSKGVDYVKMGVIFVYHKHHTGGFYGGMFTYPRRPSLTVRRMAKPPLA